MKEKILKHKNKIVALGSGALCTLCTSVPCFAAEETPAASVDWSSAGSTITSQFNGAMTTLLPVGIGIFATLAAIGFGPKIFKKIAK